MLNKVAKLLTALSYIQKNQETNNKPDGKHVFHLRWPTPPNLRKACRVSCYNVVWCVICCAVVWCRGARGFECQMLHDYDIYFPPPIPWTGFFSDVSLISLCCWSYTRCMPVLFYMPWNAWWVYQILKLQTQNTRDFDIYITTQDHGKDLA